MQVQLLHIELFTVVVLASWSKTNRAGGTATQLVGMFLYSLRLCKTYPAEEMNSQLDFACDELEMMEI